MQTDDILDSLLTFSEEIAEINDYMLLEEKLLFYAKKLVGADRGTVWYCDDRQKTIYTHLADGIDQLSIPMNTGLVGTAIQTEESIICNDVSKNPKHYSAIDLKTGYKTKNTIIIPFKNAANEIIGALQILNKDNGKSDFCQTDLRLLNLAVSIVGATLNTIFLNFQINKIFEYVASVADEGDVNSILARLADMGKDILRAERTTIWLADNNKTLSAKVAQGIQNKVSIPFDSGLVGHSYITGEPVICNDPYNDSRFNQEIDKQTGFITKSVIAMPLRTSDGRVVGAFQCVNKIGRSGKFEEADFLRMKMIASYIAKTAELNELTKEIENTQKELIFRLGAAGETRSKETGNHVKRVAEYSAILAKYYGLDKESIETLLIASPMHDIGKIAIPDEILNKPGKLTATEFDIMKKHAEFGHEILAGSSREILKTSAIIALQHHEKWDGSGYPSRLEGENIHIFGRITALADVFDALGSDRCYKKAWQLEQIYELINEQSGKHFDPTLVEIFFKHLDEILEIRHHLSDEFGHPYAS